MHAEHVADTRFCSFVTTSLDTKRRPTLPAALLTMVHIEPGDELLATPVGEGQILLQSRSAALREVRQSIRSGFATPPAEGAVARFREERAHDHTRSEARGASTSHDAAQTSDAQVEERGAALLAELDL